MSERQVVVTTCPRDCPDACGIYVHITGGKVVGISGDRKHEYTHSYLCRKAFNYVQRVYSPDRLLTPKLKVDGAWRDIDWEPALDLIANKIRQTIVEYGGLSMLHYQSAGSLGAIKMLNKRFFNLLGGVTEASGSLCGGAGIAGQTLDFGYRTCHDPFDLINSKFIILWGRNPSETNMHLMPILKAAQSRGARVVLIDPVNTDTRKFCDMHIQPKPGMDGYLALGMAKIILESGKADTDFIENHSDNYSEYKGLVDSLDLETLSTACGVSVDDIKFLATYYAGTKPAAIMLGWGMQRYEWGAETFRLIDALGAITGNIGVSGGGVNHGRDESEFFDPSVKGKELTKQTRQVPKALFGKALKELSDPPIKMAFINGANPLNQSPDIQSVKEAFAAIDFVVVFEQFLTDTAESADIVLPVTTYLEESDVVGSYWHTYVGLVSPAVQPLGQAKTDLEIYQALAKRLGIGEQMEGSAEDWIKKIIKPLNKAGITFESLKSGSKRIPSIPKVAYEDKVFKTKSGKFNLITEFSRPSLGSTDYPLVLLSTHTRQWMHSQVLPAEHQSTPEAQVNPKTAQEFSIEDGQTALIVSPVGRMSVVVRYDDTLKEGVVSTKQGRWAKFNQSANQLTSAIMSREGQNACYYQTTVRLQRI